MSTFASAESTTPGAGEREGHVRKFQELLRELFQFDCADLDFGIYRIMNHKRDVVERFIAEKLPQTIDDELSTGLLARQALAKAKSEEAREKVLKVLGPDSIDAVGEIGNQALAATPVAREYLDARARAGASRSRAAVEVDVYNHLTAFFSRYYEDGDFVSKRRYSRKQRYAIPYNGEEVYLHWANSDQYYVKTAEHFHSYDWKAPNGVSVRFRVDEADVEQNNVKGERRLFLPRVAQTEWDEDGRTVMIPFAYRPLTAQEKPRYGRKNQQEKILAAAVEDLPERLGTDALAALGRERRRNARDEPVSYLEHHLRRYTRRNDSDFFIHKDLRGFLTRELDFYLKNEVLNLDDLAAAGEFVGESWFQVLQLIRAVGGEIIDFLAQIEGFQKMLWEKRKFVIETNWCMAMRCVPPELYPTVAANEAQWAEWRLLSVVPGDEASSLFDACRTKDERIAFLKINPTLMLDTVHFAPDFTDVLLSAFGDLDEVTDGVLFRSENWQALRLMRERHAGSIHSVYIDPPYNTDASAILYKNGYKDSSWLSLMENGLEQARALLAGDGVVCCAIDDEEAWRLRALMQSVFGQELGIVPVRSNPAGRKSRGQISPAHEYAFFFGSAESTLGSLRKTEKELARYPFEDQRGRYAWNNLIRHGSNDRRADRPKMFYPIYVDEEDVLRVPEMEWNEELREYGIREDLRTNEVAVWPVRTQDGERVEKNWHRGPERVAKTLDQYRVRRVAGSPGVEIDFKIHLDMQAMPKTWWDDKRYASANLGARSVKDLFGEKRFDFAKAIGLVEDCLRASKSDAGSTTLDFFAGSGTTGHAVINLNREDGGCRRFTLVEMGDHFDTVVLPRLKKVAFSAAWKNGRPLRSATPEEAERSPRLFKYLRLESYEDALDSIRFDEEAGQLRLEDSLDGYLLNYMLKWETKDSETLLNPAELASPFSYRLRVHANGGVREQTADVAETFNYLLGLCVRTRRVYRDGERRYLVFRGETRDEPGRATVVIWRDTEGWTEEDLAADRDFVAAERVTEGADAVYVNGMSSIPGARPIEPLFKARMFAGVSDG